MNIDNLLAQLCLFWQYPVITEKEFYIQNKGDVNYIPFPWATIIDAGWLEKKPRREIDAGIADVKTSLSF